MSSFYSEEVLDKVTDEDLAAAQKLALKFGPEEGDAPDYVNYPERTRLVNTFQVRGLGRWAGGLACEA